MTPLLAALAKAGLPLLVSAVTAKGKEVIEEKLGVDLEEAVKTEEGQANLHALQIEHEEFLVNAALEKERMRLGDVADSRASNVKIQESVNASWLAKNAGYILDFVIVGATILLITLILFKAIPPANKEIVFAMLGSLLTLCGTVVQWHRGSSSGSSKKDDAILGALK